MVLPVVYLCRNSVRRIKVITEIESVYHQSSENVGP